MLPCHPFPYPLLHMIMCPRPHIIISKFFYFLSRWLWSKTWRWQATLWYKNFLNFGKCFMSLWYQLKSRDSDVSHYNVSGYGGFGPGLPGGQVGPGAKPGYPVGTGVCSYECTVNWLDVEQYKDKKKSLLYFSLIAGVGQVGLSPAQAKAAKYGSLSRSLPRWCFFTHKLEVTSCVKWKQNTLNLFLVCALFSRWRWWCWWCGWRWWCWWRRWSVSRR